MKKALDFKNKTIKQIKLWAWAAAILPISALAAVVFVWKFMDESFLGYLIITGETVMFTVAVIWWWWALYVIRNLIRQWDNTKSKVEDVQKTISEIRTLVNDVVSQERTK
jgi:high-affinity Fe2+/Pb2+ permease